MSQFLRPDADNAVDGWTTTPLWDKVDEVVFDQGDFIQSPNNPSLRTCRLEMSAVTDPEGNIDHRVRFRIQKNSSGGRNIIFTARLKQGTSTVIRFQTFANLGNGWSTVTWLLTGTEADNITDYSDLQMEFSADVFGSGAGRRGQVAWTEIEVPDAPGGARRIFVS